MLESLSLYDSTAPMDLFGDSGGGGAGGRLGRTHGVDRESVNPNVPEPGILHLLGFTTRMVFCMAGGIPARCARSVKKLLNKSCTN